MVSFQKARKRPEIGKLGKDVEALPDELLQQVQMVGQPVEDLHGGEAIAGAGVGRGNGHVQSPCPAMTAAFAPQDKPQAVNFPYRSML